MKISLQLLFVLSSFYCTTSFSQELSTETLFERFLVSEDESIGQIIIDSGEEPYKSYCKATFEKEASQKAKLFTKFIDLNPEIGLSEAYVGRGIAKNDLEQPKEAFKDFEKAIDVDEENIYGYFYMGDYYLSAEEYKTAIDYFNDVLRIQPDFLLANVMRGLCYSSDEQHAKAIEDFTLILGYWTPASDIYFLRGNSYYEIGENKKAIKDWKKAKKLNSAYSTVINPLIKEAKKNK